MGIQLEARPVMNVGLFLLRSQWVSNPISLFQACGHTYIEVYIPAPNTYIAIFINCRWGLKCLRYSSWVKKEAGNLFFYFKNSILEEKYSNNSNNKTSKSEHKEFFKKYCSWKDIPLIHHNKIKWNKSKKAKDNYCSNSYALKSCQVLYNRFDLHQRG